MTDKHSDYLLTLSSLDILKYLFFIFIKQKKREKEDGEGRGRGEEIEEKNISFPVDITPGHCVCYCERFACTLIQGLEDIVAE